MTSTGQTATRSRGAGRLAAALVGVVALIAACSNAGGGGASAPATAPPATAAPTMGAEPTTGAEPTMAAETAAPDGGLAVANDPELGAYVTGENGMALYVFLPDEGKDMSQCTGDCAANWPPLTEELAAGAGITGALGTIEREDGTTQVTLGGWPLYYFGGDQAAGDVNGQGLNDVWYLASPAGTPVGAGDGMGMPEETGCTGRYCY